MRERGDDTATERRAALHAALGDPHRLAIVEALTFDDRSPSELAEALGMSSNLLAHHLLVLGRCGLVETMPSAGDGRRRYVTLRSHVLDELGLRPPPLRPSLILFVCSANSARSPVAAALWRQRSEVPALSAGTRPARRIHPLAVTAAARAGIDISTETPRAIEATEALDARPDLVITVCDEANEALGDLHGVRRLHWSTPDPVRVGRRPAFDLAVARLRARIEILSNALDAPGGGKKGERNGRATARTQRHRVGSVRREPQIGD